MNKPLTKEEREHIERATSLKQAIPILPASDYVVLIWKLREAEAFWREAVKTVNHRESICPFCDTYNSKHSADCPWLLAQGEV